MADAAIQKRKRTEATSEGDGAGNNQPVQGELFVCEIANWPVKDDLASMEIPLFSLSKNKDLETREYRRGNRFIRVIPSSVGAATVFDKDLLLYIASQIVEQLNLNKARGEITPVSRTVRITSTEFLLGTERSEGGASYERILDMLRRLRGTTVETNIPTGNQVQTEGFSLIDHYAVLSEKKRSEVSRNARTGRTEKRDVSRVLAFTVTVSEWLYNGLLSYEVLTLDRGYFRLTRSIERRLYEIARKHCGDQALFKINIDLLADKIGTKSKRYKFRDEIRTAIKADRLPDYRIALDNRPNPDEVVFYTRDSAKLSRELIRVNGAGWFTTLERADNLPRATAKLSIADV
jgi:plasmid replication initiation protein